MNNTVIEKFVDYKNKTGDRKALYKNVAQEFSIKSAIYPGSFIDISPSLVIPNVIYIDNFKGAISFFKNIEAINDFVEKNKEYEEPANIGFIGRDYTETFEIDRVDLIISQYAGFVGQATKYLLKKDGILLCNDSHGDATLAKNDDDYEFIGIVDEKNHIVKLNTEKYFLMPKGKAVDLENVKLKMKGPRYTLNAWNYLFRKKR